MGLSIGAVVIKQNPPLYDSGEIVNAFFGSFKELKKEHLNNFDCRKPECVGIYKTRDYVIINSSRFVEGFYKENNQYTIEKIFNFFKKPKLIFSFEEYDSGGAYGYSVSVDGKLIRYYRSISYDPAQTFGEPFNIEEKWLQADKIKVVEDGAKLLSSLTQTLKNEYMYLLYTKYYYMK